MLTDEKFLKLSQISYIDFPNIIGIDKDGNKFIKPEYANKKMEQIYDHFTI